MLVLSSAHSQIVLILQCRINRLTTNEKNRERGYKEKSGEKTLKCRENKSLSRTEEGKQLGEEKRKYILKSNKYIKETKLFTFSPGWLAFLSFNGSLCAPCSI